MWGDLTLIMGCRFRLLQRASRERTNCESRQSSIGFPRNGLTKAATPSLSLEKSLCKGFCFTFLPVRALAYPPTSCREKMLQTLLILPFIPFIPPVMHCRHCLCRGSTSCVCQTAGFHCFPSSQIALQNFIFGKPSQKMLY